MNTDCGGASLSFSPTFTGASCSRVNTTAFKIRIPDGFTLTNSTTLVITGLTGKNSDYDGIS